MKKLAEFLNYSKTHIIWPKLNQMAGLDDTNDVKNVEKVFPNLAESSVVS
jgi:hypothetical protein